MPCICVWLAKGSLVIAKWVQINRAEVKLVSFEANTSKTATRIKMLKLHILYSGNKIITNLSESTTNIIMMVENPVHILL